MKSATQHSQTPVPQASPGKAQVALARLHGEPVFSIPADLYIPPDALEVFLEEFEGPLDLLLYLIRRQNFDILDIPMLEVTRQYLDYVDEIRSRNLELAAEYLLMAAMLIEIKSRMLLPRPPRVDEEDENRDPRAELVRRLLEYERIKLAAQRIGQMPQQGRDFALAQVYIPPQTQMALAQVAVADLQTAWADVLRRASLVQHHRITREALSVREYMSRILRRLQGQRFVDFEEIFESAQGASVLVVTLVALLELAKENLVEITQAQAYAPIYVRLTFTPIGRVQASLFEEG